jgi:hypothetical protein
LEWYKMKMRRGWRIGVGVVAMASMSLAGCYGTADDDGDGGGGGGSQVTGEACQLDRGCGGDPTGTWRVDGPCGDGSFDRSDQVPQNWEVVEQKIVESSGTASFKAASGGQKRYQLNVTAKSRQVYDMDPTTVEGKSPQMYCQAAQETFGMGFDEADCELVDQETCRCTFISNRTTNDAGTYTTADGELSLVSDRIGAPRTSPFCVEGDSLRIDDQTAFSIGLTRTGGAPAPDAGMGDDAGSTADTGPSGTTGSFAMTVDGASRDFPTLNVLDQGPSLSISATSADGTSVFSMTLLQPSTGEVSCGQFGQNTMSYSIGGSETYQAGGGAGGSCAITLTTVEDGRIAGSFSGELQATQGASGAKSIGEGAFDISY